MIKRVERATGVVWQVYGRRNGKNAYVGTFESKREAESAERRHLVTQEQIAAGELPPETDANRTFGAAAIDWLASLRDSGSRSLKVHTQRVDDHLRPTFGDVPLIKIRRPDVVEARNRLSTKVSASTANTIIATLSIAFSWFLDRGWVSENPCRRIKRLETRTRVFPWLQSGEAITRLLSECTPSIRDLVAVLVGTGMRLDEALHLRWDDVDLEHRLITVHRGRQGTTKSGKARHVPIFDSVLPVLKAMRLARGRNVLLWPGGKAGKPLSQPSVWKPFKEAVETAGLPSALRLHDLRHSFASLYLVDGGDIFKLSRILGHSSVAITEKTYAHLKPDAFEADYGRVRFAMPFAAPVVRLAAV